MQSARMIGDGQRRALFGYGKQAGMNIDMLHEMVHHLTKKTSIKELTAREADRIIGALRDLAGKAPVQPRNRASIGEQKKILALAYAMGWMEDRTRLRSWLEKRYGASDVKFLTDKAAFDCIEAMKQIQAGGRADRKR